jgi:hypothetical protein
VAISEISLTEKTNFTNKVSLSGILNDSTFYRGSKCLSLLDIGNFKVTLKWNKSKHFQALEGKHVFIQGRLVTTRRYNDRLRKYISNVGVLVEYMEVIHDL